MKRTHGRGLLVLILMFVPILSAQEHSEKDGGKDSFTRPDGTFKFEYPVSLVGCVNESSYPASRVLTAEFHRRSRGHNRDFLTSASCEAWPESPGDQTQSPTFSLWGSHARETNIQQTSPALSLTPEGLSLPNLVDMSSMSD